MMSRWRPSSARDMNRIYKGKYEEWVIERRCGGQKSGGVAAGRIQS